MWFAVVVVMVLWYAVVVDGDHGVGDVHEVELVRDREGARGCKQ